ncbi:hypothetical protein CXB77_08005 [Chromatium okenii]|uniref:Uncharacterized protein n=1 Tax=Chromatium okenii TaxID=61644 RepID=A0A2S7XSH6_9GAMM|nr:hypothetical protein CXB77_08005 [Chromatium okenii]
MPLSPFRISVPLSPIRVSLSTPPLSESSPRPPMSVSLPLIPEMVSSPPNPSNLSAPGVPTLGSAFAVNGLVAIVCVLTASFVKVSHFVDGVCLLKCHAVYNFVSSSVKYRRFLLNS